MKIEEVNSIDELMKYERDWNQLYRESLDTNFYLNFYWVVNWWKYFGKDYTMHCFFVYEEENNEMVMILPLMGNEIRFGMQKIEQMKLIGEDILDIGGCISRDIKLNVIDILALIFEKYPLCCIRLFNISKNEWKRYENTNASCSLITNEEVILKLSLKQDWIEQFTLCTSGLRYDIKKGIKLIEEKGMEIKVFNDAFSCEKQMEEIDSHSHKVYRKENFFISPERKEWISSLLHDVSCDKDLGAVVVLIYDDEKPIAYALAWIFKDRAFFYQTSFDQKYGYINPGHVLISILIQECQNRGIRNLSMGRGLSTYKYKWTKEEEIYRTYTFYHTNFVGNAIYHYVKIIEHIRKKLLIYYKHVSDKRIDKLLLKKIWVKLRNE